MTRICGIDFLESASHAADEAATADGGNHHFEIGNLFQQFQPYRALSRDDCRVVEGVHESQPLGGAAAESFLASLVVVCPVQNHVRAVAASRHHLVQRSRHRHAYLGRDSSFAGVEGNSLGVIARRSRDQAALALRSGQGENLVERPPFLVRTCHLQVLKLQENIVVNEFGEHLRAGAGRDEYRIADPLACFLHFLQADHEPFQ